MSTIKGAAVVLNTNTGTDISPVWTKIAGQRGVTINLKSDSMEITSKDSGNFKEFEPSYIEWSIDADGLLIDGDAGFAKLEDSFFAGTKFKAQIAMPSGENYEGMVFVSEIPLEFPFDDSSTYKASMQGTGELSKVTSV